MGLDVQYSLPVFLFLDQFSGEVHHFSRFGAGILLIIYESFDLEEFWSYWFIYSNVFGDSLVYIL